MLSETKSILCWGINHHSASIDLRERISPSAEHLSALYQALPHLSGVKETVIISTCNRLEIYLSGELPTSIVPTLRHKVAEILAFPADQLEAYATLFWDSQAVHHLFCVCGGLDSQIVGEVEITGQVKAAFADAVEQRKTTGPIFNQVFQKSFQNTKWVRTHTDIGKGHVNIATVAVDLAMKIFGRLKKTHILVLGAGDIAEKTVVALKSRGASNIRICNRTFVRAQEMSEQLGGTPVPIESLDCHLMTADVVICSTSSKEPVIQRKLFDNCQRKRAARPICLLDLALPRDVDAGIGDEENVFLYNLDDLASIAEENLAARIAERDRCMLKVTQRATRVFENVLQA